MNIKLGRMLLLAGWMVVLSACQTTQAPNDSLNVKKALKTPSAHLNQQHERPQTGEKPVERQAPALKLPRLDIRKLMGGDLALSKRFSVAVRNVPVKNFLYSLARDAGIALDMRDIPDQRITLIMKKAPLKQILDRVSEQVGLYYSFRDGVLTVERDRPVWRNYYVDYVNIDRKAKGTINLNMSVGGSVGGTGGASAASGGNMTGVEISSDQSFWKELENGVRTLLGLTDGATGKGKALAQSAADGRKGSKGSVMPRNRLVLNREAGMLSVYAPRRLQAVVKGYIEEALRRAKKQVLIEATVVEVLLSDNYKAGIDWANWSLNNGNVQANDKDGLIKIIASENASYRFSVDFGIDFLQKFGNTRVLSTPKIMAINNQTAILKVVDNKVYFTTEVNTSSTNSSTTVTFETELHTVPVGFMMTLTPFVNDDEEITLYIRPTLSRIVEYVNDPHPELARAGVVSRIPVVQEREVSSVLKLKNGQVAIIGGLMQDEAISDDTSLPGLGAAPGVGHLFTHNARQKRKTELVIFIRPTIIRHDEDQRAQVDTVRRRLDRLLK